MIDNLQEDGGDGRLFIRLRNSLVEKGVRSQLSFRPPKSKGKFEFTQENYTSSEGLFLGVQSFLSFIGQ